MDEVNKLRNRWILDEFWRNANSENDNVPCEIKQGVFLGYVGSTTDTTVLMDLNITHVLVVGDAMAVDPAKGPSHFKYKRVEVLDSVDANLVQSFEECVDFIVKAQRERGGVLVRSVAGKSRSVTVIVAYLMRTHQMSLYEALCLVWSKRPHAAPAQMLFQQLQNYERHLRH